MMITKFKNGNINFKLENEDWESGNIIDIDAIYNNSMFWNDLSIQFLDDEPYIIDFNTQLVYNVLNNYSNVLMQLKRMLEENNGTLKLFPLTKNESIEIIEGCLE